MFIHSVYFWLKADLGDEARGRFLESLHSLNGDGNVRSGYAGAPADTGGRDVVDDSYSYGLVLVFEDRAGHDSYQTGAVHRRFLDAHRTDWERILVYDFED
ncbi:MAG: Dabb family protein [Candidatus Promineifilaceae bacterium]|jgi:hypothetical protein